MKVIFIKELPPQIKKGQIKNVADGYARNYLLPKKIALPFTRKEEQKMLKIQEKQDRKKETEVKKRERISNGLTGKSVLFNVKASEDGTLYAGIGKREIVDKIYKSYKIRVEEDNILLKKPIKSIGQHQVELQLTPEKKGNLVIDIQKSKS